MSKPQMASEPSMEEILASIRKMIADDRPGPSPMPDQMGRTPFGEPARPAAVSEFSGRAGSAPSQGRPSGEQPSNFNSLADALKVATALSDQRRSLQQEIAKVLERGPRGEVLDPLGQLNSSGPAPTTGRLDTTTAPGADTSGPRLPEFSGWRSEPAAPSSDGKRELTSFDFGTVVPQRTDASGAGAAKADKPDMKADVQSVEEPRIVSMPSRGTLNATSPNTAGSNAAAVPAAPGTPSAANGATVAPFPRPVREVTKEAAPAPADKATEKPAVKLEAAEPLQPVADASPATDAAAAKAEALLDAVVDLVQQQPNALSVFTSGASFISGVGGKKVSDVINAATASPATSETADAAGVPATPPKIDRAAAELLRPMLRQWLADNMGRILEEALRSELTEQTQGGGKGPGKA